MKRLLLLLPLLFLAGESTALERHDMTKMTCDEIRAALETEGKSILTSPSKKVPGMMKFERYVPSRLSCGATASNWAQSTHIRTADGRSCLVYRCVAITRNTPRY